MVGRAFFKFTTIALVFILIFTATSCSSRISKSPEILPGQLVANVSQAKTDDERLVALRAVVSQSLSLGFVDEKGRQLNSNISNAGLSLTADDLTFLSYAIVEGQGYMIEHITDFLAAAGIKLSTTGKLITAKDLLPDLQKYVDWSYSHQENPRSLLGFVLASGAGMQTPGVSLKFKEDTRISTTAALMLLADLLLGVPKSQQISALPFEKVVYADEVTEAAEKVKGLITVVEAGAGLASLFDKVVSLKSSNKGASSTPSVESSTLKVPDMAKRLVAAFAMGSRFGVRLYMVQGLFNAPVVKSMELLRDSFSSFEELVNLDRNIPITMLTTGLVLSPGGEPLPGIPATYTLNLISPDSFLTQSAPLFPDADAVFVGVIPSQTSVKIDQGGHRLGIYKPSDKGKAFNISIKNCVNSERRVAILHLSAQIDVPDLAELVVKNMQYVKMLQLNAEDLLGLYSAMQKAVQVAPWMCEVIIPPARDLRVEPAEVNGENLKFYSFTARSEALPAGYKYQWTISGSTGPIYETQEDTGTINYSFPKEGTYTVRLKIVGGPRTWPEVFAKAVIKASNVPKIDLIIESPEVLETLQTLNFKVKPSIPLNQLPQNIAWKWDFNDGTAPSTKTDRTENGLIMPHNFSKNGNFPVNVSLIDRTTNNILATATRNVKVDDSASIAKTNSISLRFGLYGNQEYGIINTNGIYQKQGTRVARQSGGASALRESYTVNLNQSYRWLTENSFEANYNSKSTNSKGNQTITIQIKGQISVLPEGIQVNSLKYTYDMNFPNYEYKGKDWKEKQFLELKDIPLTKNRSGDSPTYQMLVTGQDVKKHLVRYEKEEYRPAADTIKETFLSPIWDNLPAGDAPLLELRFDTVVLK